ncbi:hypothetical protein HK096_004182, partial [Nowakowskiella sp. JEL0078]
MIRNRNGDTHVFDDDYVNFSILFENIHLPPQLTQSKQENLNMANYIRFEGLLDQAVEFCHVRYNFFSAKLKNPSLINSDFEMFSALKDSWFLERNTWKLLSLLLSSRLVQLPQPKQEQIYASDRLLVESLLRNDREILDLMMVKLWLEQTAPDREPEQILKAYRSATVTALTTGKKSAFMVENLDPDVCGRERKRLALSDESQEVALNREVFELLRRGKMEEAQDLCVQSHHPWKAASLRGSEFSLDSQENDVESSIALEYGNPNRDIWRAVCFRLAKDVCQNSLFVKDQNECYQENCDQYERATYSFLSGDVKNALTVCETWEDYVWINFSAILEREINNRLSMVAVREDANEELELEMPATDHTILTVFESLVLSSVKELRESALSPFHHIQARIILSQSDAIFEGLRKQIENENKAEKFEKITNYPQILRFVAHLGLALRIGGFPVMQDNLDFAISAYIELLIASQKGKLVALYTAHLPVMKQIEKYSSFLSRINDHFKIRYEYLQLARSQSLDVHSIANRTVDKIFSNGVFMEPLPEQISSVHIFGLKDPVSELDRIQIRAIEWVTWEKIQYVDALSKVNTLMRRFLVQGRVQSALELRDALPEDLIDDDWKQASLSEEDIARRDPRMREIVMVVREYATYTSLISCLIAHGEWVEIQEKGRKIQNKSTKEHRDWINSVKESTDKTETMFRELIESGWRIDAKKTLKQRLLTARPPRDDEMEDNFAAETGERQ